MSKVKKLFCILSNGNKVIGIYSSFRCAERDCYYLNTHLTGSYFVQSAPFVNYSVCDKLDI